MVGGRLYDFDRGNEWVRHWELFLSTIAGRELFSIPIYELAPKVREVGGIRYYICDAVLNFALFRKSIFPAGVSWDEQFKSNGEHEDFYLNLKLHFPFKVAHLPTMVAYHHHPEEYRAYRARLRDRNEGWRRFFRKWDLEQHVEFGLGVRTIDNVGVITEAEEARARFFVNADLSLQRPEPTPDTLLIGDFEKIATIGALDETGNRTQAAAQTATLLLDPGSRELIAVPETAGDAVTEPADAALPPEELDERYRLESFAAYGAVGFLNEGFFFRYDPVLRDDADFYLWYARDAAHIGERSSGRGLACSARWSGSNERVLVWKSERKFLDLEAMPYWRPLLLDPPVWPRDCRWLRFDLVADGGPSPDPICTGFLFPGQPYDCGDDLRSRPLYDAGDIEVLGLSRLANDGAAPGRSGRPLAELARDCPRLPITLQQPHPAAELMLLPTDAVSGLEAIFFVGWQGLGRSLVSARLPGGAALSAPAAIAVPAATGRAPAGQIFAYGASRGFVALAAALCDLPVR